MAIVHMTEAELVKNVAEVLRQVRQGNEIVVEQGNRPFAVIKPSRPAGPLDFGGDCPSESAGFDRRDGRRFCPGH